ncbi:MAG TPA: DNA polymerase II large subunit [Methanosarcinales archaeon]|nr:DNA polymerase II large subunit [Methanosarcinales archaeon]
MKEYFDHLQKELENAIEICNTARKRGADPSPKVEILTAEDLASRVENLIGLPGIANMIRSLEKSYSREETALMIGKSIVEGKIKNYNSKQLAVEDAIRTAVAILTEGVVSAPIEGIARVDLAKNDDGTEYIKIYYSGPIRGAGGTAQALSILVADYVRRSIGIERYKPRPEELERYIEEIFLYRRSANLQYTPTTDEIRLIAENCPICIDGEPTESAEVSGYRDLERVETNRVRGGMAFVFAEGLILKAPKIKKYVEHLKLDGWSFLDKLIKENRSESDYEYRGDIKKPSEQLKPRDKYIKDLIAGRPVFSHPSRPGGFRLRYGRSRNTGLAAVGVNPATMFILDNFIAPGTQVKVERPGKAAAIAPVDSIEGPTVLLKNGEVLRIDSMELAISLKNSIAEILDIGEILINYGDFLENNHPLVPASYCFEWWIQELEKACADFGFQSTIERSSLKNPSQELALELSEKYNVPLHPKYTYLWHDISIDDFIYLAEYISSKANLEKDLIMPIENKIKNILETLLIPHKMQNNNIIIQDPIPLLKCIGLDNNLQKIDKWNGMEYGTPLTACNYLSGITVRERAPVRIGARMGRPEKSKEREMTGKPHVLFPVGDGCGKKRSLKEASNNTNLKTGIGEITVEIGIRICPNCKQETFLCRCECGSSTKPRYFCPKCKIVSITNKCPKCQNILSSVEQRKISFKEYYLKALNAVGERDTFDSFKGVQGLISRNKTPEPLEKGVLRAKHDVCVFKDGTVRYDLSNLPITHFTPKELGTPIKKLKELGYEVGFESQIIELKVQDVILSTQGGEYLFRTAKFIDDLLVRYYKLEPYYRAQSKEDLVGKLLIGLAPHTSAGVLCRLIGYTRASVGYAHPFFHAAKRRNCDGDEDSFLLLMDGLLNFSLSYLPDQRGGRMDAPLVLTTKIDPKEIDKEAQNLDVMEKYPLEFYRSASKYTNPKELEKVMDLVSNRLGSDILQAKYKGFKFTHDTTNIADGPINSAYKTLKTMIEKMEAQLDLAKKIRAVDEWDVAERVINSHFIPDLIGNLRAFSRQKVRCVKCNTKYRRPPLQGNCPKCGGNILLTVNQGSVKKYLDVSLKISENYDISDYTKQRLQLLNLEIKSLFESDKEKQLGLADYM